MDKLRKSFKKSLSPINNNTNTSISEQEEQLQVLLNQMNSLSPNSSSPAMDTSDARDIVVKINTREIPNKAWRDSSYDFSNDEDVIRNQKNNTTSSNKEFDFITDSPLSVVEESPNNNVKVLFNEPKQRRSNVSSGEHEQVQEEVLKQRRSDVCSGEHEQVQAEVLKCTSSSPFRRKSSLLVTRTKSRLMDPTEIDHKSQKITMKSGFLGKVGEVDEEDPFWDEDLPEEYKKMKFSTLSVVQLVSLILIIAALVCSLVIRELREKRVFELELWKWALMVLVLISGRLVSGWMIRLIVYFIERNFLWRKRVVYFVYGLRNAVQNCIWLSFVLVTWQCIFDKRVERVTNGKVLPTVSRIWVCLLVGTFIWLVKTLLVKVLAMSFHVTAFFNRIQESLFNQYVIEVLSGPPLIEIQNEQEEEEKVFAEVQKLQNAGANLPADLKSAILQKRPIGTPRKSPQSATARSPVFSTIISKKEQEEERGITIDHLHRLNQKNISAWNMKRLMNIVRKGVLSTLHDQLQQSTDEDESAVEITSEKQAKVAARKIFNNVAKPCSKFIYLENLMRFMREDEALKTMRLFDSGSDAKGVSKRALKNWVVNAFRERRALALSLNDTKTAVNKLHQMLNVLVAVIILLIWLLILRVATTHFLVLMSSQVLLVVFMFGNSAKTTFEAIIFLFVMHPFDVGDRLEVEGVQMIVEEMNILTTVFLRYDNQKIIYPNSVLSTKPISNYYRSPHMGDAIDFCIHISTPMEKIATMKERIIRYIENKSDHWYPDPMIVMRDVEDLNRIKWSVWLSHTMNHQDMGERWARRAVLIEEMVKIFRELDIEYRMLPVDVNVRNLPTLSSSRVPSNWTVCA